MPPLHSLTPTTLTTYNERTSVRRYIVQCTYVLRVSLSFFSSSLFRWSNFSSSPFVLALSLVRANQSEAGLHGKSDIWCKCQAIYTLHALSSETGGGFTTFIVYCTSVQTPSTHRRTCTKDKTVLHPFETSESVNVLLFKREQSTFEHGLVCAFVVTSEQNRPTLYVVNLEHLTFCYFLYLSRMSSKRLKTETTTTWKYPNEYEFQMDQIVPFGPPWSARNMMFLMNGLIQTKPNSIRMKRCTQSGLRIL